MEEHNEHVCENIVDKEPGVNPKTYKIVYITMKIKMKKYQAKEKKFKSPLDNPKKVKCCDCKKSFELTFVVPKWDWSAKNDWFYWTEKEENKGKYKCNSCLLDLYYNHKHNYWELVNSARKRQQMRTYVYDGTIST